MLTPEGSKISRWLRPKADTTGIGCPCAANDPGGIAARRRRARRLHASGLREFVATSESGGIGLRPQPPANSRDPLRGRKAKMQVVRLALRSMSLRMFFATHLRLNYWDGCDIRTVQELLGHASVETTMIYTHVLNKGGSGVRSPLDGPR